MLEEVFELTALFVNPSQKYNLTVSVIRPSDRLADSHVTISLHRLERRSATAALAVDFSGPATALLRSTPKSSRLSSLVQILYKTEATKNASTSQKNSTLSFVSLQEISSDKVPRQEDRTFTRVWLLAPAVPNIELLLHLRKNEIEDAVGVPILGLGVNRAAETGCDNISIPKNKQNRRLVILSEFTLKTYFSNSYKYKSKGDRSGDLGKHRTSPFPQMTHRGKRHRDL
ncbi:hypothetical protein FHG87_015001 [Trinorchestia longiramus]|nr:hypothetical protein FHG87_015001 [Trinorchestia longiramus]